MDYKNKKYIAIIGDIRNSRNIINREDFQKTFISKINEINKVFYDAIESKFTVTLGDEFQGLINDPIVVLDIITYLRYNLNNVDFRYGIGIGNISTEINKEVSIGADGKAYQMARESIDRVKINENSNKKAKTDIYIMSEENSILVDFVNLSFCNMKFIYDNMNLYQKKLVNILLLNKSLTINDLSKKQKISYQSVNKSLNKAGYYFYKKNYEEVKKYIGDLYYGN